MVVFTRIVSPTGSWSPKSSRATVCPMTALRLSEAVSSSLMNSPFSVSHCQASANSGVTPTTGDEVLLPPAMMFCSMFTVKGATFLTPGTPSRSAAASSSVSEVTRSSGGPNILPPPAETMTAFGPKLLMLCITFSCIPLLIETTTVRVAMPTMTPSIIRNVRVLYFARPWRETCAAFFIDIRRPSSRR